MISPKKNDAHHFRPKLLPVLASEIERKDVFVFFRGVLGEFDRAVRALIKPLRVLAHVGMIRGTIDREIERDLHSAFTHFALEPVKIFQRTKRRLDRFVTARLAPNCPRHTRISRVRGHRIVSPFAVRMSDRMNWWKINHVEPHPAGVIYPRQTLAERRSTVGTTFGRARKKFVPSGDLRFLALDDHSRRRRILRRPRAIRISRHQDFELTGTDDVTDLCVVGNSNAFGQFPQTQCIFSHMRSP